MRIATWNVYKGNLFLKKGLHRLFSHSPDVVALQEVPYKTLHWLKKEFPEYALYYVVDFLGLGLKHSTFTCLLTRLSVVKSGEFVYSREVYHSFLSDVFYKLGLNKEHHLSVFFDLMYKGKKIRFQTMRLSCAVGPSVRRFFMRNLFRNLIHNNPNVILGDLNVPSGKSFNLWAGPFKGNKSHELFYDERPAFDNLIDKEGFKNIFSSQNTMDFPGFDHQLDHVLIPKTTAVYNISLSKNGCGSDHKMLFTDVEF